jgi:hypothetical protein
MMMSLERRKGIISSDPARRVEKATEKVIVMTNQYKIVGFIYAHPGSRVLDMLNGPGEFIPLTNVILYNLGGDKELDRPAFVAVPKRAINMLIEAELTSEEGL